jgi:hypothetical protein
VLLFPLHLTQVVNDGELPLTFSWDTEEPFSVRPKAATLEPGQTCPITAMFFPREGTVFVSQAVCRVDGLLPHEMRMTGVGKFAYLSATTTDLNFGEIQTGDTATQTFTLRNQSLVNATFKVVPLDENEGEIFKFSPVTGVIPPEETLEVTVKYSPHCTGMFSSEHFEVITPGGNTIGLTCDGLSVGPDVTFSTHSMNFGDVFAGQDCKKPLRISNGSTLPANFQILAEQAGVFEFQRVEGIIPEEMYPGKAGYIDMIVTFKPTVPCNYYKRVYILLKNQQPVYIDLLGTCYDLKLRPAPFSQRHVDAYRAREASGRGRLAPEALEELDITGNLALEATQEIDLSEDDLWDEIFREFDDPSRPVTVDTFVDFGSCTSLKVTEPKSITVTNTADAKVTCNWVLPNEWVKVFPESADVLPRGGQTTFQVHFRPGAENMYYGCTLEAFVSFKTMRNFRLVTDKSFVPPWHVEVEVQGHTFAPGAEHFLPKVELPGEGSTVFFPAASVPGRKHQTLALKNLAHTPLFFNMDTSLTDRVFSCKPMRGLVQPSAMQMVALRFMPEIPKSYESSIKAIFNTTPFYKADFPVAGTGFLPTLEMANNSTVYFKPTCVGSTSEMVYKVTNPSRMTTAFEWDLPPSIQKIFTIEPREGLIRGNETLSMTCVFNPNRRKKYHFRVCCELRPPGSEAPPEKVWLIVSGAGEVGEVSFEPVRVDFDTVIIGGFAKRKLRLRNASECPMHWSLEMEAFGATAEALANEPYEQARAKEDAVEFEARSGVLTAGSFRDLTVFLRPTLRGRHDYNVKCLYSMRAEDNSVDGIQVPVCQFRGEGAYPHLNVTDLWCHSNEGVAAKRVQWDEFNIDMLNENLGMMLTDAEIANNDPEGPLKDLQTYIKSLVAVPLVFTSREQGHEESTVTLQFENIGNLPLSWFIKYPDDLGIEPEHWAEKESPSEEMVKQGFVIDEEIFSVFPRGGDLMPGQRQNLEVKYQYKDVSYEQHHLNVILQIENGKQVVMQLTGTTLKIQEKCLLTATNYELAPVAIGAGAAPVQTMEIHNTGEDEIKFQLDVSGVEQLCKDSYNYPVLTCNDPAGMVDPGKSVLLRWAFNPIEDKDYAVKVPLVIQDGPTYDVTVLGRGYHPDSTAMESLLPPPSTFPERPTMLANGQLVVLSHDSVTFGSVPAHSVSRRLVIVHNVTDSPVRFEWDMRHPRFTKIFEVQPTAGSLQPGECCVCRIRLKANVPETYKFDALCRVWDEYEEEQYEATLRELQRQAEEAADDEGMGNAPKSRRRKKPKKRLSVVATSTLPHQPKPLFATNPLKQTGSMGQTMGATGTLGGTSASRLGTARSNVSGAGSATGSALTLGSGTRRSGTGTGTGAGTAVSFTEVPEEDEGPPEPPRPYVAWTTISATVVSEDDFTTLTRPASEHLIIKKGRAGAEALLSETGGLNMPLIEGGTVASAGMDEDMGGPQEVAPASDAGAVSSAEQALTVLLADLTKDPDVEGALTTIAQEKTPFYAALIRPSGAGGGGERPSSVSPTEDRPTSPAETGPAGLNGQGRAVSPIVATGDESTAAADDSTAAASAADLDMSAEMEAVEAPAEAAASKTAISAEQRRALLSDPFVESLLESALENTFFNLMSEAVHGEFNLHAAPRLIIQNVHEDAEAAAAAAAAAAVVEEEEVEVPTGLLRSQSGVHQTDAVAAEAAAEMPVLEEGVTVEE